MIDWLHFKNVKALRDTRLPLSRFTLIVGANGSGKSTVLQAIQVLARRTTWQLDGVRTAGAPGDQDASIQGEFDGISFGMTWRPPIIVRMPDAVMRKLH
ncbi:MAG: AAA family ATPase, partial [Verrucomicrobiae bacterium]|nr:AAA family ATPase [Verrucomicrobiae bacterium]